jgi:hypothetical protein
MTARFAALEARVNAAVASHLANATADLGGGVLVDGEFGDDYAEVLGMTGSVPTFRGLTSALVGVAGGSAMTINSIAYTVTSAQPDGAGMTRLLLQEA